MKDFEEGRITKPKIEFHYLKNELKKEYIFMEYFWYDEF